MKQLTFEPFSTTPYHNTQALYISGEHRPKVTSSILRDSKSRYYIVFRLGLARGSYAPQLCPGHVLVAFMQNTGPRFQLI